MRFTVEDEPDLTLPEKSWHRARLVNLNHHEYTWTDRDGNNRKGESLEWWFEVTATKLGPEYVGRKVKGQTQVKINNRDGNAFREWAEALMRRPMGVGDVVETDDLIGLEAEIQIGWRYDKNDTQKRKRPFEYVADVRSVAGAGTQRVSDPWASSYSEPPF